MLRRFRSLSGSQIYDQNRTQPQIDDLRSEPSLRSRILLIIYNPVLPRRGGRRIVESLGWNDPDELVASFIEDLDYASHGYCKYEITIRIEVDAFPIKADGFSYSTESYHAAWKSRQGFHKPDWVDYHLIMSAYDVVAKVADRIIDEIWLMGFPYAGFYESRMAGLDAFWCNAPPLEGYRQAGRRFVIMGFNYERGVGEMLESYGHRAESILANFFQKQSKGSNLWRIFTRHDLSHPGHSEVGTLHFAPNSRIDYDWGNKKFVLSKCDNWYNYPDLNGEQRLVNCQEWGDGDIRAHHLWWLRHIPHVEGQSKGILNNWWRYVMIPDFG